MAPHVEGVEAVAEGDCSNEFRAMAETATVRRRGRDARES